MNTTEAARIMGKKGGSVTSPAKAQSSKENGRLGGRYGLIYEPAGRAREYAELACNIYSGCAHGCIYCYAPSATRKDRSVFNNPTPRPLFLERLSKDAKSWKGAKKQVLLSFTTDPFQPIETTEHISRESIKILKSNGFPVCILTKGGSRSLDVLDILGNGDSFASTLTFLDTEMSRKWEPNAAEPSDRIETLKRFHDKGIYTWVSLEPTIDPAVSLEIIRQTHEFVDLYKVGKLNYCKNGRETDWGKYVSEAISLTMECKRDYIIKNDLSQFIPSGLPQRSALSPV